MKILPGQPSSSPDRKGLDGASIVVDGRQLTWSPDNARARAKGVLSAPLPGEGASAVGSVVQASYVVGDIATGARVERLLFLGEDGTCLWTSRNYLPGSLDEVWPLGRLAELEAVGVTVGRETFLTARAMQKTHRGSASKSQWFSLPLVLLPATVFALIVIAIVVALA